MLKTFSRCSSSVLTSSLSLLDAVAGAAETQRTGSRDASYRVRKLAIMNLQREISYENHPTVCKSTDRTPSDSSTMRDSTRTRLTDMARVYRTREGTKPKCSTH